MSTTDTPIVPTTDPADRRSSGRPPVAMTALAGRIRALHRSEPLVTDDERTAALAELTDFQLQLERLIILTRCAETNQLQLLATTFDLAREVDRLARLWPHDAIANLAVASAHRPSNQKAA